MVVGALTETIWLLGYPLASRELLRVTPESPWHTFKGKQFSLHPLSATSLLIELTPGPTATDFISFCFVIAFSHPAILSQYPKGLLVLITCSAYGRMGGSDAQAHLGLFCAGCYQCARMLVLIVDPKGERQKLDCKRESCSECCVETVISGNHNKQGRFCAALQTITGNSEWQKLKEKTVTIRIL